jgi:hypothetical protein
VATFALLPGSAHGPWAYATLVPEIERLGHRALALDTPGRDLTAGIEAHARLVADAVGGTPDLVVVGHSLAGCYLPLAAKYAGATRMIFLAAMVPVQGTCLADQVAAEPGMIFETASLKTVDEHGRGHLRVDAAKEFYYHDCPDDVAEWAAAQLADQAPTLQNDRFPAGGWPDIPASYIVCADDRCVAPAWSRRVSRERLGVEAIELAGGHSPFLSRPSTLARVLIATMSARGETDEP